MEHPIGVSGGRVLVAKPGMDAHWRGAAVVARILRAAGFEVVYLGHARPAEIAAAARDEDVDVIGLSTLSGNHMGETLALLDELGRLDAANDIAVMVGGAIPPADRARLREHGVAAVFGPGARAEEITAAVAEAVARRRSAPERVVG